MSAVTAEGMRAIEEAAFRRGISAGALMDQAGAGAARRLLDHFPRPGAAVAYLGKGHNAGDALVILEHLHRAGWRVGLRAAFPETEWAVLPRQRRRRLAGALEDDPHPGPGPLLLLDGLLGIGARGALRPPLDALAAEIARRRRDHGAIVAAIDLPSGLDATSGQLGEGGVRADLTLVIAVPKLGQLDEHSVDACGRLLLVPLDELPAPAEPGPSLISPESLPGLLPPRPHDFHKGDAGRLTVIAGSAGMEGAGRLAAGAALRAGAGLVTLLAEPGSDSECPPEVMRRRQPQRFRHALDTRHDALVLGPGLGLDEDPEGFLELLREATAPTLIDADGLNRLAAAERLDLLRPQHLITPHPGEFARLAPDLAELPRLAAAARFVERHPATLLLKGARSVIAAPGVPPRVNPTGHAGMASGGQGDVLAGICGALLAADIEPADAASLGAWLAGRAAERALTHGGDSEQSCTASETIAHLGGAFLDWRQRRR